MLTRRLGAVALLLFAFTACKAPEAYQAALESFSHGAELEIRDQLSEEETPPPDEIARLNDLYQAQQPADESRVPAYYYAQALAGANKALRGSSQLAKNQMLDNTYAIKALSQWKLGQYEAADETAKEAEPLLADEQQDENDVRDLAMMRALPGLMNIDQAFAGLQQMKLLAAGVEQVRGAGEAARKELYESIKAQYEKSVTDETDGAPSVSRGLALIERAADLTPASEEALQVYLINAKLAGLDNWGDLLQEVFVASRRLSVSQFAPDESEWIRSERSRYDEAVDSALEKLRSMLPDGEESAVYQFWFGILRGA